MLGVRMQRAIALVLVAWSLCAGASAQTAGSKNLAPGFTALVAADKLVLVPPDVELFSLSGGGITEPRADWTAAAQQHMRGAIAARKAQWRLDVTEMSEAEADEFAEQIALHAAVAQSIALHHASGGVWALPTKAGQLVWSFGDAMAALQARTGARYGLFIWVRDSYASAERKAAMVALALLGVAISGGVQVGYASLVDLQTGQVVWFNLLVRPTGDLREPEPAKESIDVLLTGFPVPR
jgi:glucose dehydrogenase